MAASFTAVPVSAPSNMHLFEGGYEPSSPPAPVSSSSPISQFSVQSPTTGCYVPSYSSSNKNPSLSQSDQYSTTYQQFSSVDSSPSGYSYNSASVTYSSQSPVPTQPHYRQHHPLPSHHRHNQSLSPTVYHSHYPHHHHQQQSTGGSRYHSTSSSSSFHTGSTSPSPSSFTKRHYGISNCHLHDPSGIDPCPPLPPPNGTNSVMSLHSTSTITRSKSINSPTGRANKTDILLDRKAFISLEKSINWHSLLNSTLADTNTTTTTKSTNCIKQAEFCSDNGKPTITKL